ncbi:MAG: hypothetical protein ACTSPQ_17110 [Candidatus Helarchaeota archaeon]
MNVYLIKVLLSIFIIIGGIILTILIFPNYWVLLLVIWILIEVLLVYLLKLWEPKKGKTQKIN